MILALRSLADGALFAEAYGLGTPRVLAMHGWGRRGRDFAPCLDRVPALALDLPGFGASPPPRDAIGAEGYAEIVAGILGAFDQPPVVVGHSFGGRVAVCLAAMRPATVGPLILTGVPLIREHPPPRPSARYRLSKALNRLGILPDRRMETIRTRSGSADYRAASGMMRQVLVRVLAESYENQLNRISSPIRLIWGASDREVPVSVARRAAEIVGQGGGEVDLQILEGVGHHVPLEAPAELRSAIQSLLG